MGKLLLIDVDGTLCGRRNTIPASAAEAIGKARKNGHRVFICTGRSKAEIYEDIWAVGLDGCIGGNGCFIEAGGKTLMHKKLTEKQCRHVVDWCRQRNMELYLECNSGLYPSPGYKDKVFAEYRQKYGCDPDYGQFFDRMTYGACLYRDDVNKISFMLNSWQDYLDAREEFPELFIGYWGGEAPHARYGDVSPQNVNKASAINYLLEYLGETKENVISFGDAAVDLPMFACSGFSVAMGSGEEGAKKAADYVTTDTDDDGLWNAFVYLKLIEGEMKHA